MLWIADDFGGENAYYMSHAGDRGLADGVDELIRHAQPSGADDEGLHADGLLEGCFCRALLRHQVRLCQHRGLGPADQGGQLRQGHLPQDLCAHDGIRICRGLRRLNGLMPEAVRLDADLAKNIYPFAPSTIRSSASTSNLSSPSC